MLTPSAARMTENAKKPAMVVFATRGGKLTAEAKILNDANNKAISRGLRGSRFNGEAGESEVIRSSEGIFVVLGLGLSSQMLIEEWHRVGTAAAPVLDALGVRDAGFAIGSIETKVSIPEAAYALAEGLRLGLYRENDYTSKVAPSKEQKLEKATLYVDGKAQQTLKKLLEGFGALFSGQELARKLVDMPPNFATPSRMAEEAQKLAGGNVEVKVIGEKELEKLGANLLLGVGRGSVEESQMIVIKYTGAGKKEPYRALVGKGVMFDTGGIQVKPSRPASAMADMKCDMAGAAAVIGTIKALSERKSPVNVIGVLGCVTNRIGSNSFLPSEILTAYDGTTVEVLHTDAEGRLVLADCVAYVVDKEKPIEVIDLATLTGAIMIALGGAYAGLFSNSDSLANKLIKAGNATTEKLWRMPINPLYRLKSSLADISNSGSPYAGSSSAAMFIEHFAKKTPWAHLDIAGVAMPSKGEGIVGGLVKNGASGYGVRLLVNYLEGEAAAEAEPGKRRRGRPRKVA